MIKRKQIQFSTDTYTLVCYLTGSKKTGYGIKLMECCNEQVRSSCTVESVSMSRRETLKLIHLCIQEDLSPVHLPDVVSDFHTAKDARCSCADLYIA